MRDEKMCEQNQATNVLFFKFLNKNCVSNVY